MLSSLEERGLNYPPPPTAVPAARVSLKANVELGMSMLIMHFSPIDTLVALSGMWPLLPQNQPQILTSHSLFQAARLPLIISADRPQELHSIAFTTLDHQSRIDIACIHHMGLGQHLPTHQCFMNQRGLLHVGSCCIRCLNTSDQMRISSITRLTQMHFLSIPGEPTFSPNMSLWIVRRA
jgi:hypothetical protein